MNEAGYVNPDVALAKKIFGMVKTHPEFVEGRIKQELSLMVKLNIIKDLWKNYERVKADPSTKGTFNKPGDLVSYLLGITSAKPTTSFQNEKRRTYGRASFPDIDMDIDYERRHEIEEYIREKYGNEHVGQIGTVQKLKTKAALRRVIKVLDPEQGTIFNSSGEQIQNDQGNNFQLQNTIVGNLPTMMRRNDGSFVKSVREAYREYPEFARWMDEYPEVYRISQEMEGSISAFGCLAKDTLIKTKDGWARIDQIDGTIPIAYVDSAGEIQHTTRYKSYMTGVKKCYKMKLDSGDWIKVTDEHQIFTDQGCVLFAEIKKNPKKYKVYSIKE